MTAWSERTKGHKTDKEENQKEQGKQSDEERGGLYIVCPLLFVMRFIFPFMSACSNLMTAENYRYAETALQLDNYIQDRLVRLLIPTVTIKIFYNRNYKSQF